MSRRYSRPTFKLSLPGRRSKRRLLLERLEPRLTLSAVHGHEFSSDVLVIEGTESADDINVTYDAASHSIEVANSDGTVQLIDFCEYTSVFVDAGGGDDQINIDPNVPAPVKVLGGEGNDTLVGVSPGTDRDVLFTSGEYLSFDNRSCESIECIRSAEGESGDLQFDFTASLNEFSNSAAVPPSLLSMDHDHGSTSSSVLSSWVGSIDGAQDQHQFMQESMGGGSGIQGLETVDHMVHASMGGQRFFSSDGSMSSLRFHGRTTGDSGVSTDDSEAAHVANEESMMAAAMATTDAPIHNGEPLVVEEENIDAILAGWTGGEGIPANDEMSWFGSNALVSTVLAETANLLAAHSASSALSGTPSDVEVPVADAQASLANTEPGRANGETDRSSLSAVTAMAFAVVAGGGAYVLEKRATNPSLSQMAGKSNSCGRLYNWLASRFGFLSTLRRDCIAAT